MFYTLDAVPEYMHCDNSRSIAKLIVQACNCFVLLTKVLSQTYETIKLVAEKLSYAYESYKLETKDLSVSDN